MTLDNRTRAHATETWNIRCIHHVLAVTFLRRDLSEMFHRFRIKFPDKSINSHLKNNDPTTFVACCQKFTIIIELHAGDNIGVGDIIIQSTFDLRKTPRSLAIS